MKSEPVAGVQPELLKWARETVGLSELDVSKSLKQPLERIQDWETGKDAPTYSQLEKLAYQIYKRPLAVFFLPAPPEESKPQKEFRTLPDADLKSLARDTHLHIRRAHAYQIALKELFGDRNPVDRKIWKTLSLTTSESVAEQAEGIRKFLGITMNNQAHWKNDESALKLWRKAIEDAGVFVFKAAFKQQDISGFCLIDENLPIIYLNNSTTKTRQIFSLLHELAHLLMGNNGISKFETAYVDRLPKDEKHKERFCNAIAAEALIPSTDFEQQSSSMPDDVESASEDQFSDLANRYGVSREAILRRFLDQGRVGKAFYELKAKFWASQKKATPGGSYYLNQGAYLSSRFAKEVISRHYRNQITLEQASDYLGIKPKSFSGFEDRIMQGTGA